MTDEHPHLGSSLEDFLKAEGRLEEATDTALKRVIARMVAQAMRDHGLSKAAMAREMQTSRSQLDRLLDPDNTSVTLTTLQRAAAVVGHTLRIELV